MRGMTCILLPFVVLYHLLVPITRGNFLKTPLPNILRKPSGLGADFIDHIRENRYAVSVRDKDGYLPIHVACMSKCSFLIIHTLLEAYPESAFDKDLKNNKLPLQYLVEEKNVDIECLTSLLALYPLSAGVKDDSGMLPLHHVSGGSALQSQGVIQALIEAFPGGAGVPDDSLKLPVAYAMQEDADDAILSLLLRAYPRGAHALLVKALEAKQWPEAIQITNAYPAAAGVRSKNGKVLPLGVAVSKKAPLNVLISLLDADPASAAADKESSGGFDFMSTLEHAYQQSPVKASQLLLAVLPINQTSGMEYEHHSGFWWTSILSRTEDKYEDIVDLMLVSCAQQIQALANCHDEQGRRAVDIATPLCRQLILSRLNFYGRYELQPGCPAHQSATCVVRFAMDHQHKQEVALKFMKYRDHFERELFCRRMLSSKADVTRLSSLSSSSSLSTSSSTLSPTSSSSPKSGNGENNGMTGVLSDNNVSSPGEEGMLMDSDVNGVRTEGVGDSRFVLSILRTHNSDEDVSFKYESDIKGFSEYPYCLVMDAADRSLADVMTHEHVAGKDWKQIRLIMEQIIENLDQMHSRGFIHGDMKPQNIVRDGARMKLIDLESSVCYTEGAYAGVKVSSAYAPPEMVQLASASSTTGFIAPSISSAFHPPSTSPFTLPSSSLSSISSISETLSLSLSAVSNDPVPAFTGKKAYVKALHRSKREKPVSSISVENAENAEKGGNAREGEEVDVERIELSDLLRDDSFDATGTYSLLPASPSYDMWSVGVIFFELCAGEPLFLSDEEDNIDADALVSLEQWSNDLKRKKLSKVNDPYARHLLSQLLQKDPKRRPLTRRVLAHPFLTGKKAQRLVGEKAEYDVFISYRVASDANHAERLYNLLTARGLKVWWDRVSLEPGVPWEEGFCEGLMKCKSFVPLLSREGVKGFMDLNEHSRCDNVLLEYRMAQELRAAGFIEKIFPVMIGDKELFGGNNGGISNGGSGEKGEKGDAGEGYYMYNDYLQNGCHPFKTPSCSVISVENKLRAHFDNTALGAPFVTEKSVSEILSDIMANQGGFVKGRLSANLLMSSIVNIDIDSVERIKERIRENKEKQEKERDMDAFSSVVDSIVKMLGMDRINNKNKHGSINGELNSLEGFQDGNFDVFDILSPGVFQRTGGGGLERVEVTLKDRKTAVERQIAYWTEMLADLNDEESDEDGSI